jgi:hypothetical protein
VRVGPAGVGIGATTGNSSETMEREREIVREREPRQKMIVKEQSVYGD